MAQLAALVVSHDDEFRPLGRLLRAERRPDRRDGRRPPRRRATSPDVVIVDIRGDARPAMARDRAAARRAPDDRHLRRRAQRRARPDPSGDACRRQRVLRVAAVPEDDFHGAVRRTRRDARRRRAATARLATLVFFGAKGGAGTTTVAVNCARRDRAAQRSGRRSSSISSRDSARSRCSSACAPRYTVLDALDNLHRLDSEFLNELLAKHKSGLEILAGSDQFERPGAADAGAIEELFRVLGRAYEYVVVDAGSTINACTIAALYAADTFRRRQSGRALGAQRAADDRSRAAARRRGERVRCCSIAPAEPF